MGNRKVPCDVSVRGNPGIQVIPVHINQFRMTDILAVPWENYGAVSSFKVIYLCGLLIKTPLGVDLFHRKLQHPHYACNRISEVMYRATRSSTEVFDCKFCVRWYKAKADADACYRFARRNG